MITKPAKIGLVVVAGLIGIALWSFLREKHGVGVDSVWWLPAEAHNITYLRNDLNTMAEFDIEREPFEKWCVHEKMSLRELRDEGYHTVHRCVAWLEDRGVIAPISEPNEEEVELRHAERAVKVFRVGDLFYEQRWDNGGGYSIGYDTKEKRGYYEFSRH